MNTSQSIFPMNDQHKAKSEEWHYIKHWAVCRPAESAILELLNRIEALEAAQHAHADASHVIDPERQELVQELAQAAGFSPRCSEFARCAASVDALNEAKPAEQQTYYLYDKSADSQPQPNHREIPDGSLLSRVACADGPADAIREVAAWMREQKPCGIAVWAQMLEGEAER